MGRLEKVSAMKSEWGEERRWREKVLGERELISKMSFGFLNLEYIACSGNFEKKNLTILSHIFILRLDRVVKRISVHKKLINCLDMCRFINSRVTYMIYKLCT